MIDYVDNYIDYEDDDTTRRNVISSKKSKHKRKLEIRRII